MGSSHAVNMLRDMAMPQMLNHVTLEFCRVTVASRLKAT